MEGTLLFLKFVAFSGVLGSLGFLLQGWLLWPSEREEYETDPSGWGAFGAFWARRNRRTFVRILLVSLPVSVALLVVEQLVA